MSRSGARPRPIHANVPSTIAARAPGPKGIGTGGRVIWGLVSLGCLTLLSVAAWLNAAPAGHGTHTQLGLTPCLWEAASSRPCPTCGMTTAFAHAADGDLSASFATQPMGSLLAVLAASLFWASGYAAATGSQIAAEYEKLLRPRSVWLLAGLAAAAWVYKLLTWG